MREIVLDTETTGLDPNGGHRIVEIGCVELHNRVPTGETFWEYINPERDMPTEAFEVHGLSEAFLADKPVFAAIAQRFVDFVGDAPIVIHNAAFDMKFLNAELKSCGFKPLPMSQAVDTVAIARSRFPGAAASLDALCKRFGIDNAKRTKHGALLDSELLAEVYLELMGGRQAGLELAADPRGSGGAGAGAVPGDKGAGPLHRDRPVRPPRPHAPSAEEEARHAAFLEKISEPIWRA
ncbi:DNA polymerase III subunit epsilon [Marivibrio halodurans]|uniref:DNA polymerase III subunit epsilon n=1 Tax=Marivibrio halodurans TaxID=2039722 RepID=A0A8J7V1U9_9PROT|nr:DNA polymerase III subunit epsilon [Marivibrio halodurans]MBP5858166.1 DNA polymerase III subunit epsilon [Marivibrio halodurans]